jgi:single-stranded-DNA-specific exonuclease
MLFGATAPLPERIDAVYRLDANEYQGQRGLRLIIEHWNAASG